MPIMQDEVDLEPIWINIIYDSTLQRITKKTNERTMCNRGCPFFFILQSVLVEHPAIPQTYAPGILGFTVNGIAPETNQRMRDGDVVKFIVCHMPSSVNALS